LEHVKQENDYVKSEHNSAKNQQVTEEDMLNDDILKEMSA